MRAQFLFASSLLLFGCSSIQKQMTPLKDAATGIINSGTDLLSHGPRTLKDTIELGISGISTAKKTTENFLKGADKVQEDLNQTAQDAKAATTIDGTQWKGWEFSSKK